MTIYVRKRSAVMSNRLRLMAREAMTAELLTYLKGLSHADFRAAGIVLAEDVLPDLDDESLFWKLFHEVVAENPRAFLGTFLKAALKRYNAGKLTIAPHTSLVQFSQQASPIDCKKALDAFLPKVKTPEEVKCLLCLFGKAGAEQRVAVLLKADTPAAYCTLFQELRTLEGKQEFLYDTAVKLMHKQTPLSFNMASIMQAYFSLKPLPGAFSLHLEPYELSRLEQGNEAFLNILKR